MMKCIVFCLISFLQYISISAISQNEVINLLDTLNQTTLGNILAATDKIDDLVTDLQTYVIHTGVTAKLKIENAGPTYQDKFSQIKLLNSNAAFEICFENTENELYALPGIAWNNTDSYVENVFTDIDTLNSDSKYIIDVYATKVQEMAYRFNLCSSNDSNITKCLDIVAAEIKKQTEELPTKILSQVSQANESGDNLKQSTQTYLDQVFAQLIIKSDSLILKTTTCIEELS